MSDKDNTSHAFKSISWYPNGDIRLVLNHEKEPDMRIQRGSPEALPFDNLLLEVLSQTTSRSLKADLSRKPKSRLRFWNRQPKPKTPKPSPVVAPESDEPFEKSYPKSQSVVPKPLLKKKVKLSNNERTRLRTMGDQSLSNRARGDVAVYKGQSATPPLSSEMGHDADGPPDSYYDKMESSALVEIPDWAEPNEAPVKSGTVTEEPAQPEAQPEVPDVESSKSVVDEVTFATLSESPENWITSIAPETWINKPTLTLGDYSNVVLNTSTSKNIKDVNTLSHYILEQYEKSLEIEKAQREKPVEIKRELIRWPDGENGTHRFAVAVGDKQVPVQVDEQFGKGLVKMMEAEELEHITALRDPVEGNISIAYVKTTHFDSLIPVEEAARMSTEKYFPTTYPRAEIKPISVETQIERLEAIKVACDQQETEIIPSPVAGIDEKICEVAPMVEISNKEPPTSLNVDEVPEEVLEAQSDIASDEIPAAEVAYVPTPPLAAEEIPSPPPRVEVPLEVLAEQSESAEVEEGVDVPLPELPEEPNPIKLPEFVTIQVPEVQNGYNEQQATTPAKQTIEMDI